MKIGQIEEFPKNQPEVDKTLPRWNNSTKKFEYVLVGKLLAGSLSEDIYEFTDTATWVVEHGIDGYPQVVVTNTARQVLISNISYDTTNKTITVSHGSPLSGRVSVKKIITE